jgi:hypothetical protein
MLWWFEWIVVWIEASYTRPELPVMLKSVDKGCARCNALIENIMVWYLLIYRSYTTALLACKYLSGCYSKEKKAGKSSATSQSERRIAKVGQECTDAVGSDKNRIVGTVCRLVLKYFIGLVGVEHLLQ